MAVTRRCAPASVPRAEGGRQGGSVETGPSPSPSSASPPCRPPRGAHIECCLGWFPEIRLLMCVPRFPVYMASLYNWRESSTWVETICFRVGPWQMRITHSFLASERCSQVGKPLLHPPSPSSLTAAPAGGSGTATGPWQGRRG